MPCTLYLTANAASRDRGFISTVLDMSSPTPRLYVTVNKAADVLPAMEAFADTIHRLWPNASFAVSAWQQAANRVKERKVPGFDAATQQFEKHRHVTATSTPRGDIWGNPDREWAKAQEEAKTRQGAFAIAILCDLDARRAKLARDYPNLYRNMTEAPQHAAA